MSNVKSVSIVCNVSKGEIATTVQHNEAERVLVQDAQAEGAKTYVMIKARRFTAYSATPRGCAESVASAARESMPGVPVSLAFC